jgi:uncharacterized repeat protein (TIGR03803 family)
MIDLRFGRHALGIGLAVALLAGCGGAQSTNSVPSQLANGYTSRPRTATSYKSLYGFKGRPDGREPYFGGLIAVSGKLYGTTSVGGASADGTVFEVSKSGEKVLYSFKGVPDGEDPYAGLIAVNGKLYGTTTYGGAFASGYGTVFEVSTSGVEKVLYSFKGVPDGEVPDAGLIAVNGKLYGTTVGGGAIASGYGTIFEVSTSGVEKVLHSFTGTPDGADPYAGLIAVNGNLYGTTRYGGASGNGAVFEVSKSGVEKVLYSFTGTPDAEGPYAGLIAVSGKLYGTTPLGGASGNGAVFEVSTSGAEKVLYSFTGTPDGASPVAGLVAVNGKLYGTTTYGGAIASGYGTIFEVSSSGVEKVLYSFAGTPDGADPYAGLIAVKGKLYGTTYEGGANNDGTVFRISPR